MFSVITEGVAFDQSWKNIRSALSQVKVETGYSFSLDQSIIESSQKFNGILIALLLAIILIYIFLCAQYESFLYSALILVCIPVSLFFPLIYVFITGIGLTYAVLTGAVILSGSAVNNAILIIDFYIERKRGGMPNNVACFLSVRNRLKPVLMTSLTTISSSILFLFLPSDFAVELSIVTLYGTIGSLFYGLILLPGLLRTKITLAINN
jgi:HAE1 family hydrophobic/amphiphilic exporter-1